MEGKRGVINLGSQGFQLDIYIESFILSLIRSVVCRATDPQPLPNKFSTECGLLLPLSMGESEGTWNRLFFSSTLICESIQSQQDATIAFILRNGFTRYVSGDNSTHHQEYICCIWPQVGRYTYVVILSVLR